MTANLYNRNKQPLEEDEIIEVKPKPKNDNNIEGIIINPVACLYCMGETFINLISDVVLLFALFVALIMNVIALFVL